ncbi:MAG TPA: amidophosphoribosyltransferase [Deltaproteobacteria bacterium]|nr:amidophosphoribosyltransferase [Deltaproteobacteria bacterium]
MPFISQEAEDHLCGTCIKKRRPFSIARSIGIYEGVLLEAVQRLKYNGKTSLARPLAKLMTKEFSMNNYNLIVPVPLHKTRLKERGFNQSLLLARELSKLYNLPIDYLNLRKIRATDPQVNLKGKERIENMKGAFAVKNGAGFKNKKILLIDDVYTTGATVTECSKVLKKAGAKTIDVLTLARVVNM